MDKGGSVEVIEGSLGSGKSAVGHIEAILHLKKGGVVATNYAFVDDWAMRLASSDLLVRLGYRNKMEEAEKYYNRAFRIGNAESMYDLSGHEGEKIKSLCVGKMRDKREGYGLLVVDEAHHYFNSRTFQSNKPFVEFFANARKLGWRTIIITHSIENIDKQIRSYVEYQTRFRNLKKVAIPVLQIPLVPFNLFLSKTYYAGLGAGSGTKAWSDLNLLNKTVANLYNTKEVFRADSIAEEARPQGQRPCLAEEDKEPEMVLPVTKKINGKVIPYYEQINPRSDFYGLT